MRVRDLTAKVAKDAKKEASQGGKSSLFVLFRVVCSIVPANCLLSKSIARKGAKDAKKMKSFQRNKTAFALFAPFAVKMA